MKTSAAIFMSVFMVLVCSACASNDDDGGSGGQSDASVGFPDGPRPSDARPDSSTSTLADAPGFNLGDGGFAFGDGGFDFGDGGFGATCTSNTDCTAADDCCLVLGTFGICVTGTESGTDCIPAF